MRAQSEVPAPPAEEIHALQQMMLRQAAAMKAHAEERQRAQQDAQQQQAQQQVPAHPRPPPAARPFWRKLDRADCSIHLTPASIKYDVTWFDDDDEIINL